MILKLAETKQELLFLFDTRRHSLVDRWLVGNKPELYTDHCRYIRKVQGVTKYIYIAYILDKMVGYCQLDKKNEAGEIEFGFVVHPWYKNKGYGKGILQEIIKLTKGENIVMFVKVDNHACIRIHEKAGFVKVKTVVETIGGITLYKFEIEHLKNKK
jgi:RimJ/RimL family protein N-acetyltransferase